MTSPLSGQFRKAQNGSAKSRPWPIRLATQSSLVLETRRRGVAPRATGHSMQQGNHNMLDYNDDIFILFRTLSTAHFDPSAQKNVSAMEGN